jgi:SpoIID/LytB domain protein
VGMAQDGILSMGRAGATTPQMISTFFPGTTLASGKGQVRVVVRAAAGSEAVLAFPDGGRIDAPSGGEGFPVNVPAGGQMRVAFEGGRYVVGDRQEGQKEGTPPDNTRGTTSTTGSPDPETTTTTSPTPAPVTVPSTTTSSALSRASSAGGQPSSAGPLKASPSGGGTVAVAASGRRYRGVIEVKADDAGALRLVNALDVEMYLRGMGEVRDPSWPAAALRAQAIAARTYALRAMSFGGEICADQRCQVYLGAQSEYAAMNKAVADTAGQIIAYKGKPASAVYSANGGGHSATREEGFGTDGGSYPYLRAAPYKTTNPLPWTERISVEDIARALGYQGQVEDVKVTRTGPSGRALAVTLTGTGGSLEVTGRVFDARLGLKSTLFELETEASAVPAPPRDATFIGEQALPEEAVALPPRPPDPPLPEALTSSTTTSRPRLISASAPTSPRPGSGVAGPLAAFLCAATALATAAYWLNRPRQL